MAVAATLGRRLLRLLLRGGSVPATQPQHAPEHREGNRHPGAYQHDDHEYGRHRLILGNGTRPCTE